MTPHPPLCKNCIKTMGLSTRHTPHQCRVLRCARCGQVRVCTVTRRKVLDIHRFFDHSIPKERQ